MMHPQAGTHVYRCGFTLTVVFGVVVGLALWGLSTVSTTPAAARVADNDQQIAQYYMLSAQALYAAEAGVEEARARLRTYAGLYRIVDTAPDDPTWSVSMATQGAVQEAGQGSQQHERVASLQNNLAYTVTIRHATHPTDATVLRWGDARGTGISTRNPTRGETMYIITAHGVQGGTRHTVAIEVASEPPPIVPAALYVAGPLRMQGSRTHIVGQDSCGEQHQAGVRTTLSPSSTASTSETTPPATITGAPPLAYQSVPLHVQAMVDTLKARATVVYAPTSAETASASPAEQWGNPRPGATLHAPGTCDERHVIHYATHGTRGRLRHGTSGCGLLLVEGDVELQGDFSWYGAILATGSLHLTGGGSKQVTGGVVVGGAVTSEQGGDISLIYCSEAIAQQTRYLPLRILSWRDDLPSMP